jgi:hypothetical protein
MSPGPSAQMGMRLARLRQAGAHHGSRESATLGIQEQSLTLSVIIRYSPMQKQFDCTRKNIRSVMNSPILIDSKANRLSILNYVYTGDYNI